MKTLVREGTIYDGFGENPYKADILIQDGSIIKIGYGIQDDADRIIDAKGYIVCPGFIDIHRHCDKGPFEMDQVRYQDAMLRQGITTVVTGNCGISMYPLSQDPDTLVAMQNYYAPVLGKIDEYAFLDSYSRYIDALQQRKVPLNTMAMMGVGAVRIAVNGFSETALTEIQREKCRKLIEEALIAGAPGISLGLMYLPECYETVEELVDILKPLHFYDRLLCTHIRGEGDSLLESVREVIEIAEAVGCRLEISHLKSCGIKNWNKEIFRAITEIESARKRGVRVTCDFYPYDCGSTTLMSMIPPAFVAGDFQKAIKKLETQDGICELRKALSIEYDDWDNYALSLGWDKAEIGSVTKKENMWMLGKRVSEIASECEGKDEVDIVSDLLVSESGNVAIIIHSMMQSDIDEVVKLPFSTVISDAIYADTDRPHPRMYGSFPKMIHSYVQERKIIDLSLAIKKMTVMPARLMKLKNRGSIAVGNAADLLVFDPEKFMDHATYMEPRMFATGLRMSMINGKIVVENDVIKCDTAGIVIRAE